MSVGHDASGKVQAMMTERKLRVSVKAASTGAGAVGAGAVGALALGSFALGAIAMGAVAIGALAIGRLSVGKARFKQIEIDELKVGKLGVEILEELPRNAVVATLDGPDDKSVLPEQSLQPVERL